MIYLDIDFLSFLMLKTPAPGIFLLTPNFVLNDGHGINAKMKY